MTPQIKEIVVVEGRDDTAALKRAVDCRTIETHGYGISRETWKLLESAYERCGLIIFTDPDHAGEQIRKKLSERFPKALHAHLPRALGRAKDGDIGIENARPEDIRSALERLCLESAERRDEFTAEDMLKYGLSGGGGSAKRREILGEKLGIGYGNAKSFLEKLNKFGIAREDFTKYAERL